MSIKKIFKSSIPHLVYVTKKGKNLYFQNFKHVTDNRHDIAELEDEIKSQHPHFYIDPNEAEIDTTLQDEIAEATKAAALAVIEKHAKAAEESKAGGLVNTANPGMSAATLLKASSSASLGALSQQSTVKA